MKKELIGLSETRKADRAKMAAAVAELCEKHGVAHSVQKEFLGEPRSVSVYVEDRKTGLAVRVNFRGDTPQTSPNTFVLSWHFTRPSDVIIAGGFAQSRNEYHMCKATDVAVSWRDLMGMLERRLTNIEKGTATCTKP